MPLTSTLQRRELWEDRSRLRRANEKCQVWIWAHRLQNVNCARRLSHNCATSTRLDCRTTALCICARQNGVLPRLAMPLPCVICNTTGCVALSWAPTGGALVCTKGTLPPALNRLLSSCLYQIMLKSSSPRQRSATVTLSPWRPVFSQTSPVFRDQAWNSTFRHFSQIQKREFLTFFYISQNWIHSVPPSVVKYLFRGIAQHPVCPSLVGSFIP